MTKPILSFRFARQILTWGCVLCLSGLSDAQDRSSTVQQADLVVYGATPAGIASVLTASQLGRDSILIEPTQHIGGMITGGLGHTDRGIQNTIGGISREFFRRLGGHYGQPIAWQHEPSVAKATLLAMLDESGPGRIEVFRGERLRLGAAGVRSNNGMILEIQTESGLRFVGKVFVDASYEADLLAGAGVAYAVGREPRDQFGESLAGVFDPGRGPFLQPKQFFPADVSPYRVPHDPASGWIEGIQGGGLDAPGSGDQKIQAYNFRVCLTRDPSNRVPIAKPDGYHRESFELLERLLRSQPDIPLRYSKRTGGLLKITEIPNLKTDINDGGVFSSDYIGANWDYPEADYETRQQIIQQHKDYTLGLLWFLSSDPVVPKRIRTEMRRYGLPRDEYIDNGHWSPQVYVRESRRMVGDFVMTQRDCMTDRTKPDTIGMGSYAPDSHHIQRVVVDGRIVNEGNFLLKHQAYEIPYRILTPKPQQCQNLLVTFAVSASHVAFGSIRMEPVFMILGEAAAVAADQAIEENSSVQRIDVQRLQQRLLNRGGRLHVERWTRNKGRQGLKEPNALPEISSRKMAK